MYIIKELWNHPNWEIPIHLTKNQNQPICNIDIGGSCNLATFRNRIWFQACIWGPAYSMLILFDRLELGHSAHFYNRLLLLSLSRPRVAFGIHSWPPSDKTSALLSLSLSHFNMSMNGGVEVKRLFIGAGCNRIVNNVSWGACDLVAFGAQNAVAIFCPKVSPWAIRIYLYCV